MKFLGLLPLVFALSCAVDDFDADSDSAFRDGGAADSPASLGEPPAEGAGPLAPVDGLSDNPHAPAGPETLDLQTLSAGGKLVLLAKTGITNVTGSSIDGNVGLSPAAASFITGFSLVLDPSNRFATSPSVAPPKKVFAADYASPTPSRLTTAVSDMELAYTDAAGRSPPDFLNLSSGDIGGLTLTPGLYTWGSTVTVPADVTISGGALDTWIFQISNDLDVSTGKRVILAGGAQAKNIYWQVAGQVTIHANAHLEGIVLSQTAITLQTGASVHGRLLAQTLIALDDNAVTAP